MPSTPSRPSAPSDHVTVTHIGTATMLLRFGSFTVLTDPNFLHRGQRAYLGYGLTSRRLTEPTMQPADLPPLDLVVLSHLHGDHWDRVARHGLDHELPIWTTAEAEKRLHEQGFRNAARVEEWDSRTLRHGPESLTVTATPGAHARGLVRHLLPPVMGSVLQYRATPDAPPAVTLYITGDTLLIDALREVPRRFPDLDVAVLHLGGTTLPGGLLVTMDARQGADLVERLPATTTSVPIHNDDYTVFKSPRSAFVEEVTRRGLADRVTLLEPGVATPLPGA
ncbi:MBL fold metallo-hydrolase [Jatrophihabitans sp. YIM 134969]